MHRAMDTLLAILKLGTVGNAQRGCILELFTCASGIRIDGTEWKSAPARMLRCGASRVRGTEHPLPLGGGVLTT